MNDAFETGRAVVDDIHNGALTVRPEQTGHQSVLEMLKQKGKTTPCLRGCKVLDRKLGPTKHDAHDGGTSMNLRGRVEGECNAIGHTSNGGVSQSTF